MQAIVAIDFASWLNVALYTLPNRAGPTPSISAATIVAKKQAVPDALNQLKANTAGYGAGALVTGGTRVIMLCRPGTRMPFKAGAGALGNQSGSTLLLNRSRYNLIAGSPQTSTNTTSNKYGIHATNTWAPECACGTLLAGFSPSR